MHFVLARATAAAALLSLFFFTCVPVLAAGTGVVRGTVTVRGSATSGVTVTLSGPQTNLTTSTDANGNYSFPLVPFGHYTLTAHYDGQPDATSGVDVLSSTVSTVALDISPLKQIAQAVVNAAAAGRGVGGAPVSENVIGHNEIAALPQSQNLFRLIETVPGIVQFSYNEPVAHGFHGVTYELDGAPFPLATATNFSQVVDPSVIDSMEIITGAIPAEYGGARMGAVVNIVTKSQATLPTGGVVTAGAGTYGTGVGNLLQGVNLGNTHVYFNGNLESNDRGLDAPTQTAIHDNSDSSNALIRTVTDLHNGNTLSFDYLNQYNAYQIPINTSAYWADSVINSPSQDDVQREYSQFGSLNFTHTSADGSSYFQIIPWWHYSRTVYAGDLPQDVLAVDTSPDDCTPTPAPCNLAGLSEDRPENDFGLRMDYFRGSAHHAFKVGVDLGSQAFGSTEEILLAGQTPFFDNTAQHGYTVGAYVEDDWTPSNVFAMQYGIRYDYSTGFVEGNQISPRIGANYRLGPDTVFHAYYGRMYAAPFLEDTRREAVIIGGGAPGSALPVYDLQPEHDSYYEVGLGQTFRDGMYGYVNAWQRNATNVLDTTQIFPTPIFAVYNNTIGVARGLELRLEQRGATYSWFVSATDSESEAGGISGGTFLFPPSVVSDTSLQPEDHDQTVAVKDEYIKHFGRDGKYFASLGTDYGTGYPVQFQNGSGRLMPHLTFNASLGKPPTNGGIGYNLTALDFTNYQYLIKIANGFNTTQWSSGAQVLFELSKEIP